MAIMGAAAVIPQVNIHGNRAQMKGRKMDKPWCGFWQLLTDDTGLEIVPFNRTSLAVRPSIGYTVYSENHFIEIRILGKRAVPASGWAPSDEEIIAAFPLEYSVGGWCSWTESGDGWTAKHRVDMARDPRLEGESFHRTMKFEEVHGVSVRSVKNAGLTEEKWRKLSGPGTTPLSGAWKVDREKERWMSIVTSAHYGVMRAGINRPKVPSRGDEYSDEEILTLCKECRSNAGARIETQETFENWPFVGTINGYETRKHETFRISNVKEDRFTISIPPMTFSEEWTRFR